MTAILLGALFLATAGWFWRHLSAVDLPVSSWSLPIESPTGTLTPGQTVRLFDDQNVPPTLLGTGTVLSYTQETEGRATLSLGGFAASPDVADASPLAARRIDLADQTFSAGVMRGVIGVPIFQVVYLQAGVAVVVLLIGFIVIYWFVGVRRDAVEFLIATDGEMKKVNWSTKKIIRDSTLVVIAATFLVAGFVFLFDLILRLIMQQIGVIPS